MDLRRIIRRMGLAAITVFLAAAAPAQPTRGTGPLFPFVLPWDDSSPSLTNVSAWLETPAGRHGFVVVRDGHLFAGPKRLRILGVNLAFGANFPTHPDASKIAARMAKFGINAVRFHHMDMQTAPNGIFAEDRRTLDAGQLDRLDFFIAELKARGIYADLNLHVSRTYPGMPIREGMPDFHKGIDNLFPPMIELQKQYARDLLLHRNPYSGLRYVDDPAVVFVEINNENALLHEWWGGGLDDMPAIYAEEVGRQWNAWLKSRYPEFAALKRAWGIAESPLGSELLANSGFARGLSPWDLELHEGARATAIVEDAPPGTSKALRIRVEAKGPQAWHVQLNQGRLRFRQGRPYTLQFRARADAPRWITLDAKQAHPPWRDLWLARVPLTTDWRTFRMSFAPDPGDEQARITFGSLGASTGSVWLADVSLKPGGVIGLDPTDRAGRVGIVRKRDFSSKTAEAQRDWIRFLGDVERRYWTGMSRFLKDDLKAHALVIGTQMGWSPFPIQAELDVIDSHAYWQHPEFPGTSWDPANWTVKNVPMAGIADGGTLPGLGLSRVAGKPFICTEYNHASPNTHNAEAFLLLSAFAAIQDWDGIFAFAYSHRHDDWDARRIPGFFDIDQHPAQMATLPASAAIFLRGDVPTPLGRKVASASVEQVVEQARRSGPYVGAGAFGLDARDALRGPVAISLGKADESPQRVVNASTRTSPWDWNGKGLVTLISPRSRAVIGKVESGTPVPLGDVEVRPGPTRQHWMALTLSAIDGPDLRSPGRILVTATGAAENTAMGWKDPEKSTVGRDWGHAPSLVEGVKATITLAIAPALVHAWALDEHGQRRSPLAVGNAGGKAAVEIGPEARTLWYELEIAR